MKKWLFLTLICFSIIPSVTMAEWVGTYGQFFRPEDTVRFLVPIHKLTGIGVETPDSINVLRYYRGTRIDSVDESNTSHVNSKRDGLYEIKFKADKEGTYDISGEDSIGTYSIVVQAFVGAGDSSGAKSYEYQVLRGYGLNEINDLTMFLGSCDNCFRVLYPNSGAAPKDSVQYKRIDDKDGDGSIESGDTTFVSTVYFYHSNNPAIMDSSKIIFHRNDL